jgi:hypothetical protein
MRQVLCHSADDFKRLSNQKGASSFDFKIRWGALVRGSDDKKPEASDCRQIVDHPNF